MTYETYGALIAAKGATIKELPDGSEACKLPKEWQYADTLMTGEDGRMNDIAGLSANVDFRSVLATGSRLDGTAIWVWCDTDYDFRTSRFRPAVQVVFPRK